MQTKQISKKQINYLGALNALDYYFEGAMIPYILLGETARRVRNQEDLSDLDMIEIGVKENSLSKYSRNTLRDRFGVEWENKLHEVEGCKVFIKLIKRKYKFMKNLDQVPYWGASFSTANPFEDYWKARALVA